MMQKSPALGLVLLLSLMIAWLPASAHAGGHKMCKPQKKVVFYKRSPTLTQFETQTLASAAGSSSSSNIDEYLYQTRDRQFYTAHVSADGSEVLVFSKSSGMLVNCDAMKNKLYQDAGKACWYRVDEEVSAACDGSAAYFKAQVEVGGEGYASVDTTTVMGEGESSTASQVDAHGSQGLNATVSQANSIQTSNGVRASVNTNWSVQTNTQSNVNATTTTSVRQTGGRKLLL